MDELAGQSDYGAFGKTENPYFAPVASTSVHSLKMTLRPKIE